MTVQPTAFPWTRFQWAEAVTHFARAMGSARSGNVANSRKDIEKLESLHNSLVKAKDSYWAKQVDIQRRVATAWYLRAENKSDEALQLMQSAADLEDSLAEQADIQSGTWDVPFTQQYVGTPRGAWQLEHLTRYAMGPVAVLLGLAGAGLVAWLVGPARAGHASTRAGAAVRDSRCRAGAGCQIVRSARTSRTAPPPATDSKASNDKKGKGRLKSFTNGLLTS